MRRTRQQLLENFDDEVREKLKMRDEVARDFLSRYERQLMQLTRFELNGHATFRDDGSFQLHRHPFPERNGTIPLGLYELPRRPGEAHLYRLNHPLATALIEQAKGRDLPVAEVHFDYSNYDGKISALEPFLKRTGWLILTLFSVESLEQGEDHLVLAAVTDDGQPLLEETAGRLMTVLGTTAADTPGAPPAPITEVLAALTEQRKAAIQRAISERNARFFEAEAEKLDGWADDLKSGLEREIKDLDRQIKEARRAATAALTLEEKLTGQKLVKTLEAQRNHKRRALFDEQDRVDKQREALIESIEEKLSQKPETKTLFTIRWVLQ